MCQTIYPYYEKYKIVIKKIKKKYIYIYIYKDIM